MTEQERQAAIAKRWESTKDAQKKQLTDQYTMSEAELKNQLGKTSQYDTLENQAHVDYTMQERARKEQMANMGMSGAGGTSATFAQRNTNSLNNNIGNIKRQKKDFEDNVNLALANLKTQYDGSLSSMIAQSDAQMNAELLADDQWWQGHNLQKTQADDARAQFDAQLKFQKLQNTQAQTQFNTQFAWDEKNSYIQNLIALRDNHGITRSQFKKKARSYMNENS